MKKWVLAGVLLAIPVVASASQGAGHGDPAASVLISLSIILVGAKIGGDLAVRLRQPTVLGELIVGVILGNLALVGFTRLEYIKSDLAIDLLSRLGVLILLFEVGLESTIKQMLKVGETQFFPLD